MAFCWTIWPISLPAGSSTITRDFTNFAGRVSASSTAPCMSTICSLWVMY